MRNCPVEAEFEKIQLKRDLALAFLWVFPKWVSTHFNFQEEEEDETRPT